MSKWQGLEAEIEKCLDQIAEDKECFIPVSNHDEHEKLMWLEFGRRAMAHALRRRRRSIIVLGPEYPDRRIKFRTYDDLADAVEKGDVEIG